MCSAGPIEFIEADLSALPPPASTPDIDKKDFPVIEKPKKEGGGNAIGVLPVSSTRHALDVS